MPRVSIAKSTGDMGSLGRASNKLIGQYNFPLEYADNEKMTGADHDRLFQWDYDYTRRAFQQHMGTGEMFLPRFVETQRPEAVMALLKDLLKVNQSADYNGVEWTGWRICGTVNRSNGYPVYTLWLFAKDPNSKTKVYSGFNAPNVERGKPLFGYGDYNVIHSTEDDDERKLSFSGD